MEFASPRITKSRDNCPALFYGASAGLVGRQLRYLIGSDHGWLGGIGFGSAALQLQGRDDWIGWNHQQRLEHLERVLNLSRYLIRPSVHCPHLASHVLALCARCVGADFERRYGLRPWLLESFVEIPAYEGTCYQAANWIRVGRTQGRGRNGPHQAGQSLKEIYLYPLVNNFPERVGVQPVQIEPLQKQSGLDSAAWAGQEFGNCDLGDERLTHRLVKIASAQAAQPHGSYAPLMPRPAVGAVMSSKRTTVFSTTHTPNSIWTTCCRAIAGKPFAA